MLRKLSIQLQLLIVLALTLVLLTAVLELIQVIEKRDVLVQAERKRSQALVGQVSATIRAADPASTGGVGDLNQTLTALVNQNEDIDFIAVTRPNGEVVYHSAPRYVGQVIGPLVDPPGATTRKTVTGFGSNYLTSIRQGADSDTFYITVGAAVEPIDQSVRSGFVSSALVALGLAALVGVLIALLLRRNMIGPLDAVSKGAQRFRLGQLDYRIEPQGGPELIDLGNALNSMAQHMQQSREELVNLYRDMQARVEERTRDLQMSAEIGRIATGLRDIDTLLRETVEQIRRRFDVIYHAQIFMIDHVGKSAVLVESTGEVGRQLIAFGHKLPVGSDSVIGRVTARGQTVMASDTLRGDVSWKPNPLLPETRAEMALPLMIEGRVIGALDVQSTQPEVFTDDMVRIFQVLADQLAIAIENARLLAESERRLHEIDDLNRQLTRSSWQDYVGEKTERHFLGYLYDQIQPRPIEEETTPYLGYKRAEAPIQVHGETIGTLVAAVDASDRLTHDDQMLVSAVAERVALAVENARLFDQTQRALAETARLYETARTISSVPDLESVYQVVSEQISAIPQLDHVEILLAGPDPALVQHLESVYTWRRQVAASRLSAREQLRILPVSYADVGKLPSSSPLVYEDAAQQCPADHPLKSKFNSLNARLAAVLPLTVGTQWFGLLLCAGQRPGPLGGSVVTFASALADQLALAIENRRLFEEAQSEARRTRALAEAGQLASQIGGDFAAGLQNLFQAVAHPGNYDRWWFGLISDDGTSLHRVTASHALLPDTIHVQHAANTLAEAARISALVLVNAPDEHPVTAQQDRETMRQWGKHMVMPVRIGSALLGVLQMGRSLDDPNLDERDIQLVATLASQVAVATQNQRLFTEAESQRQRLQTIVNTMPTGILVVDREGRVLLSNETLLDLLGPDMRPDGQAQPYPLLRADSREPYPDDEWPLSRVLNTGQTVRVDDVLVLHPNRETNLLARAAPIVGPDGRVTAAVGAFQDITQLQVLEHALQDNLRETTLLYEASRMLADAQSPVDILSIFAGHFISPGAHYAAVYALLSETSSTSYAEAELLATWGNNPAAAPSGTRYRADQLAFWDAVSGPSLVHIPDASRLTNPGDRNELTALGVRSATVIPLQVADRPVGAVLVGYRQPGELTEQQVRIFEALADQSAITLENARLYQQAQRRARELSTSAEISRAITSILHLGELLPQVVTLIRDSFEYDHAQIFLINMEGTSANLVASTGEAGRKLLAQHHSLPVGSQSIIGQVTAIGEPQIALDTADARVVHRPNPLLPFTRSEMALPLRARGQILGALDVQSNKPRAFTEVDVQMLTSLADMVATAIDNARLFALAEQRAEEMSFLFNVTTAAAASPDLEESLMQVVSTLSETLHVSSASVYLPDETGQFILKGAEVGSPSPETSPNRLGIEEGLIGWITQHGEAVIVDDTAQDARCTFCTGLSGAIMAVPLQTAGAMVGVLAVESERTRAFGVENLRLLQTLSGSLSAIIQNSRLLREVQQANERLLEVDKLKTNFLAAMSHELRTPLNSIIGFSRVILKGIDGPLTDMQEQDLNTIYESGKHLLGLVNDILDQAKLEAGKMELTLAYFKIQEVIIGVMSSAVGLTRDKPIRLHTEIADNLPDVYGDEFRTRQVLLNLVSNASKFTREGSITVSAFPIVENDQPYIQVSVTDTGIGIAEKDMPLLFEAFQQIDNSLTRTVGGTGMGLPLAKSLVELQQGRIWVDSEPGVGSTFSITIPTTPALDEETGEPRAVQPARAAQQENPAAPTRQTILVIEEDLQVVSLYRHFLSREGFEVLGVNHPETVMNMLSTYQPYLILLDVNIQNQAGWDMLAMLKQMDLSRSIPVVVCTLNPQRERGLDLGAAAYLIKPFDHEQLLDAIRQATMQPVRPRILIVDDRPATMRLFREALEASSRYEVMELTSGQEALAVLQLSDTIDLVILDLRMPGVDGFEMIHALRANERTAQIPVLVLTAEDVSAEERARLQEMDVFRKDVLDELSFLDQVKIRLDMTRENETFE